MGKLMGAHIKNLDQLSLNLFRCWEVTDLGVNYLSSGISRKFHQIKRLDVDIDK